MIAGSHDTCVDDDGLLYSQQFGDHYFSRHDGSEECRHVFLAGNDLPGRWRDQSDFTIGELGFGTGLNFLVTWQAWKRARLPGQRLNFVSLEAYPLKPDTAREALSSWPDLAGLTDELLAQWNSLTAPHQIDDQTTLQVHHCPVEQALPRFPETDAWYLDGFAPSKNPDMWSLDAMQRIADHTAPNGTFASYTAAGWVRRNLDAAGFEVIKKPGFGTKRDMIAGVLR
ncbi:MAG: tRNA (5-methylaminomethyl-2-thiouridine)(34)-methyltransferase MnmD [Rhizobiaceae bacterium]